MATPSRREVIGSGFAFAAALGCPAVAQSTDPGIYFDDQKLIVQRDGDGGDTAQREGWAWTGIKLRDHFNMPAWDITLPLSYEDTMTALEVGATGEFRRHPTQGGWISDPNKFSRDQATPLIAAMGLQSDAARLRRAWKAMRPCNLILTCVQGTTDIAGPDFINLFRRGLGDDPDPNGDAFLYLGAANRLIQTAQNPEDVGDDLNLVVQLLLSRAIGRNQATDLACAHYAQNRAVSAGCFLESYRKAFPGDYGASEAIMKQRIAAGRQAGWPSDCGPVLGALRWYFRAESGGCSSLAELYKPLVERFLT